MVVPQMDPLTLAVFRFIATYLHERSNSPTLREIGDACYISHTTVLRHLDRLEAYGWIEREPLRPRSIGLGPGAPALETL